MKNKTELAEKVRDDFIIPAVDIYENDDEFLLKAEIPGASKENVEIELNDEYLEIIAKSQIPENEDYKVLDKEYRVSDYYRRFQIGNKVDKDKIKAKVENGILTLNLPKSERIKPRKIEITAE